MSLKVLEMCLNFTATAMYEPCIQNLQTLHYFILHILQYFVTKQFYLNWYPITLSSINTFLQLQVLVTVNVAFYPPM